MKLTFTCYPESFELAKVFRIARGAKTHAHVLVLELQLSNGSQTVTGWSEAVPYARYNESLESVSKELGDFASYLRSSINQIDNLIDIAFECRPNAQNRNKNNYSLNSFSTKQDIKCAHLIKSVMNEYLTSLKLGSARNLIDCACWDLLAKLEQRSVSSLIDIPLPKRATSAQTLSIDSIELMQKSAAKLAHLSLLKVKLDKEDVVQKMQSIHAACPNVKFIVDANEAWDIQTLENCAQQLKRLNVVLIEQPLPASDDDDLLTFESPITLCADESCHGSDKVSALSKKYQALNIKLDKTGGLSGALDVLKQAKAHKMQVMLGCMVGSSLAMAPIYLLADQADYIDLDGPVLVARDRVNGFLFERGIMSPSHPHLWGEGKNIAQR